MYVERIGFARPGALASVLALVLSSGAVAQSRVLVVDRSGGGDYTGIQPAVNHAQDGDTILVRPPPSGQYFTAIDIAGKSLTIAVDSQSGFVEVRGIQVRDLGPGQSVVLSRLTATNSSPNPPVSLHDNQGRVALVACNAFGVWPDEMTGLATESSDAVVALASCSVRGSNGADEIGGWPPPGVGHPGLRVRDSVVVAFDSTFTGGTGGGAAHMDAAAGGAGALLERVSGITALLALNTVVTGGTGGTQSGQCFAYYSSGSGGPGLAIGSNAIATTIDSVLAGGNAGTTFGCWVPNPGASGSPLANNGFYNDHANDPVAHVELRAPTVAREGQTITLAFAGTPGADVFLIEGSAASPPRLLWGGVLLVRPARLVRHEPPLPVGTLQPDGTLNVSYTLPQVPSGATNLWFQAYAGHARGRTIGSFAVVTVLDSIY